MKNREREIDSLADFKRQIAEYFDPWHMMSESWVPTDYCKEDYVMYDAEADRMQREMARAGLKELRAALYDVAVGNTKPARKALQDLAKKFDMPVADK